VDLREWVIAQGVHPQTAYRWLREGTLPVLAVHVGPRTILVNPDAVRAHRLLADPDVQTIVVERRDRLARLNIELVEAVLSAHGRRLVVLDPAS
jgi:putative resolvase